MKRLAVILLISLSSSSAFANLPAEQISSQAQGMSLVHGSAEACIQSVVAKSACQVEEIERGSAELPKQHRVPVQGAQLATA